MSVHGLSRRDGLAQNPSAQSESSGLQVGTEVLERLKNIEEALALLRFPMPAPLLKTSEAAKVLKVSEASVRRWIENGELKASYFDLGGKKVYRVKQADLEAFIDGHAAQRGQTSAVDEGTSLDFLSVPDCGL